MDVSIHAPRVGRDHRSCREQPTPHRFNPRAPRGARQAIALDTSHGVPVSIHAPRVGRDLQSCDSGKASYLFQSTRPAWGATGISFSIVFTVELFQSTRPAWGATPQQQTDIGEVRCVNQRAPRGSRRAQAAEDAQDELVSIHAPRVGRDEAEQQFCQMVAVSIHAPRVGRDGMGSYSLASSRIRQACRESGLSHLKRDQVE